MRILLIEDNALTVELFEAALEADGHALTVETDGIAGEARGLAEVFDIILLDIQLPGKNGRDVCRALRAAGVQVPILALSASVLPAEIELTLAAGFTRFLSKPISPQALRLAVTQATSAPAAQQ